MKKYKLILLLFTIAVFAVALALLAGCKVGGTQHEYDYTVTFDYNVDNLGVATNCETQYLGVNAGKKIVAPGYDKDKFKTFIVTNYYNEGWYTGVKDADGNVTLDKKWNFETDVVNEDMTLYANFLRNPTFTVRVDGVNDIVISKQPGEQYDRPIADVNKPQKKGYTFIDYYTDDTYTTKYENFPYLFENGDGECYALMLEGTWDIVTDAAKFRSALEQNHNMYFDVPSGELDCGDLYFQRGQFSKNFNGKIYGHGCVLKNIEIETAYRTNTYTYSLFGNLGSEAEIYDLTIQNMSFTVNTLFAIPAVDVEKVSIALFANNIAAGAKLENVKFDACTLSYVDVTSDALSIYGYYSSIPQNAVYDCFDETKLTVKRNGSVVD